MIVRAAEATAGHVAAAKNAIGNVIFGQEQVVEQALITVLCGGHGMLVGVPGLAKTKLVEAMGIVLGLDARRIQFTPDLMPSDILGSEVLEEGAGGKRSFRFIPGPIFGQLLMADEINRASPRTQSALLQAMQEQHVTVAGTRHDVPKPFHVLPTVMSRGDGTRAIVDAGLKASSVDSGMPAVWQRPGLDYVLASDEHGFIEVAPGAAAPALGEKLLLVPGHCDPTINLHDWYVGVRRGVVESLWPITARGALT
jgi:hypothetical protein